MNSKRFLILLALAYTLLSIVTVGFNYLVDPYLIMGSKRIQGFNDHKVDINNYVRTSKIYQPTLRQHNVLLLGNSRIEMGLDPAHQCFRVAGQQVYNLGLPGAGLESQVRYAVDLIYSQPVSQVFMSLDFVDFLVQKGASPSSLERVNSKSDGNYRFLLDGTPNRAFAIRSMREYYRALYSVNALRSSFLTLWLQSKDQPDRDDRGFNPARDFSYAVQLEGPGALFAQKMQSLDAKYARGWAVRYTDGSPSRAFSTLQAFLDLAAKQGIRVTLFTNPFHESFWDLMEEHDLMLQYLDWFKQIQDLVSESGNKQVSLWDFASDSAYIHEPVPALGLKGRPLQWFWEPAHYRKELGDLMLDAMLFQECDSQVVFGEKLF